MKIKCETCGNEINVVRSDVEDTFEIYRLLDKIGLKFNNDSILGLYDCFETCCVKPNYWIIK